MALNIRNAEADSLAREVASLAGEILGYDAIAAADQRSLSAASLVELSIVIGAR